MISAQNESHDEFTDNFQSESKLDIWEHDIANDPWLPANGDGNASSAPPLNNPWSSIDASSDSLWSNPTRPDSLDPWSPPPPRADVLWPPLADDTAPPTETAWLPPSDPWRDSGRLLPSSVSQGAIATAPEQRNPWASACSNPIPRKFPTTTATGGRSAADSVSEFLASHGHLVDFDNLLPPPPPLVTEPSRAAPAPPPRESSPSCIPAHPLVLPTDVTSSVTSGTSGHYNPFGSVANPPMALPHSSSSSFSERRRPGQLLSSVDNDTRGERWSSMSNSVRLASIDNFPGPTNAATDQRLVPLPELDWSPFDERLQLQQNPIASPTVPQTHKRSHNFNPFLS